MSNPFNINLIVPFKDNKGSKRKLFVAEIESYKKDLEGRAVELKQDLETLFGDALKISIVARSDRGAVSYYWRYKSSKEDRKYRRLANEQMQEYLLTIDQHRRNALKGIEEDLIYINGNLKVLKSMTDALEKTQAEQTELLSAPI